MRLNLLSENISIYGFHSSVGLWVHHLTFFILKVVPVFVCEYFIRFSIFN